MADTNLAVAAVLDALNDSRVSYHRSYFFDGEVDDSAVVVTLSRVSNSDYQKLANGTHDYVARVLPDHG